MFRQPMMNLRIYINNINNNNQLELIQNILPKFIHSLHYYYISFIASIHKLLHQIANIYIIFDVLLIIIIIIIIINATLSLYFFKTDGDFII